MVIFDHFGQVLDLVGTLWSFLIILIKMINLAIFAFGQIWPFWSIFGEALGGSLSGEGKRFPRGAKLVSAARIWVGKCPFSGHFPAQVEIGPAQALVDFGQILGILAKIWQGTLFYFRIPFRNSEIKSCRGGQSNFRLRKLRMCCFSVKNAKSAFAPFVIFHFRGFTCPDVLQFLKLQLVP